MTMDRILIIEDDPETAAAVHAEAEALGCATDHRDTLDSGIEAATSAPYRVIVLDRMLPGGDGVEAMARIRAGGSSALILILSALGRAANRVEGLEKGADDYLPKPFDVDELDARLRALLRRAAGRAAPTIRHGDIELDPAARTVRQQGVPVELSPRAFSVLLVLLEARGRVLSRQQIEERLYSWDAAIESNAVEVHIHHLRRKLGSACIQTMRGVGYFIPQDVPA